MSPDSLARIPPSGEITPRSPSSEDGLTFFNCSQHDSPTSSHSSFDTFSSESPPSLGSLSTYATYTRFDDDPVYSGSPGSSAPYWASNDLPQSNSAHIESNLSASCSPITYAMGNQSPQGSQFGSSTMEDGGQGSGTNSDLIYPGYASSQITHDDAYWTPSPMRHHQYQETKFSHEYIPDPAIPPARTPMYMDISASGQEIFALDDASRYPRFSILYIPVSFF